MPYFYMWIPAPSDHVKNSITFGPQAEAGSGRRLLLFPFTQTDAVGHRVDDRCLKYTLLVKLQPNSSRQLLWWLCKEAPVCAMPVAFPFVLKRAEVSEVLKLQFQGQRVDGTIFLHLWAESRMPCALSCSERQCIFMTKDKVEECSGKKKYNEENLRMKDEHICCW